MSKKTKKNRNSEGFNPFWELSKKIDAQMEQDGKNLKETITGTVNDDVDSVMSTSTPKDQVDEKDNKNDSAEEETAKEKIDEKKKSYSSLQNILKSSGISFDDLYKHMSMAQLSAKMFELSGRVKDLTHQIDIGIKNNAPEQNIAKLADELKQKKEELDAAWREHDRRKGNAA